MAVQTAGKTTMSTTSRVERPKSSRRWSLILRNALVYMLLIGAAFIMLFPFLVMVFTSLKVPADTFSYPPRLLPQEQLTTVLPGDEKQEPRPLYDIEVDGQKKQMALVQDNIKIGVFAAPDNPDVTYDLPVKDVKPTGGFMNQKKTTVNGEEQDLFDVEVDGQTVQMIQVGQTAFGRFVDPQNPETEVLRQHPPE